MTKDNENITFEYCQGYMEAIHDSLSHTRENMYRDLCEVLVRLLKRHLEGTVKRFEKRVKK